MRGPREQGFEEAVRAAPLVAVAEQPDSRRMERLVGPGQAMRLLYTGMLLSADEALRIGLVDELADSPGHLEDLIAANSVHSTTGMKRFVRRVLDGQAEDDAATLAVFADAFTAPDFLEGSSAFVEKRKPAFR